MFKSTDDKVINEIEDSNWKEFKIMCTQFKKDIKDAREPC